MDKVKILTDVGFIKKKLFGRWYLVRLYADKKNLLYHIIIPFRL